MIAQDEMPPLQTPQVPTEIRSHRYPELDALRGVAASTVIFHHLMLLWNNAGWYMPLMATPLRLFFAGPQAVVLFFVLSGFVLSAQQNTPRRPGYAGYLLKRMCRIYLPFLGALLLACAFDAHFYLRTPTDNAWFNKTWSHSPGLWEVAATALTSMHDLPQFNTAFWSVLIEIRVSLIFPLLFVMVKRLPVWFSIGVMLLMTALNPLIPNDPWLQTMQAVVLFLFGSLAFLHLHRLLDWMQGLKRGTYYIILLLGLMGYTYGSPTIHFGPVRPDEPVAASATTQSKALPPRHATLRTMVHAEIKQGRFAMCAMASLLAMLGAMADPTLRRVLRAPFLLQLGALSYSIYLVHGTVLFALARSLFGKIPTAAFVLLYVALVYAASELFHLLIDAPSLQLGRRVGKLPWLQREAAA